MSGRYRSETIGKPVEDELVGQRRVVVVALGCGRFRVLENLQRNIRHDRTSAVRTDRPQRCCPASPSAHGDQNRAMGSLPGPTSFNSQLRSTIPRKAIHQEGTFVHIRDSAVTDHGGETIVERDPTRDKGRSCPIAENGYPLFVNIVPRRQVVPHATDRGFQIAPADHLLEFGACARAEEIHGQQRHSPLAGVTCDLEEVFFLPMSGVAHAHDDRRWAGSGWGGQEVAFQRMAFQPGNLDHLTGRSQMRDVTPGAGSRGFNREPDASCRQRRVRMSMPGSN